jgi:hypothetical protein
MGSGSWSPGDFRDHATRSNHATASTNEIFTSRSIPEELNPKGIRLRESRDNADGPESTAIILAGDQTGSMDFTLDYLTRKGLSKTMAEIYERRPVTNPQVMFMAIGDASAGDDAPLQVSQFESDIRVAQQLERVYLERGGGGNGSESYTLPWYFASRHTAIDCVEKRNKKGYLFTWGDERPNPTLTRGQLKKVLGDTIEVQELSTPDLLSEVSQKYNVYHLIVEEGDYCRRGNLNDVVREWTDLLGEHAIRLSDHKKIAEVIVSTMQINEGADPDEVARSWGDGASAVVRRAVGNLGRRRMAV